MVFMVSSLQGWLVAWEACSFPYLFFGGGFRTLRDFGEKLQIIFVFDGLRCEKFKGDFGFEGVLSIAHLLSTQISGVGVDVTGPFATSALMSEPRRKPS
jgi:hypothetical protein